MEVLLKPSDERILAISGGPLEISAEGETEEEALANLRRIFFDRMKGGARLVDLPISSDKYQDPLLPLAGIFKNDPTFDAWQEAIQENRCIMEEQEGPW